MTSSEAWMRTHLEERLSSLSLQEEDVLLVAVSGGKDSMALLHLLLSVQNQKKELCCSLAVAHFNHETRDGDSDLDQVFVQSYVADCVKQGRELPFYTKSKPVLSYAQERKQGFEETARQLRYEFFDEIISQLEHEGKEEKKVYLLTAHHGNDQVETFLFHLARGTGMKGLCGIPPRRGNIVRPFLFVPVSDIVSYVKLHKVPYREDCSNFDESYHRNSIRHRIIPAIEDINSKFVEHTLNTIGIISEENDFLEELVEKSLQIEKRGKSYELSRTEFLKLPSALRGRALQYVTAQGFPSVVLSFSQRKQILHLLERDKPNGDFSVSYHLHIRRNYDKISWYVPQERAETQKVCDRISLSFGEEMMWFHQKITCFEKEGEVLERSGKQVYCFRKQALLFLRCRLVGDVLKVPNRPRKTVKKWCIEEKIPEQLRSTLPILCNEKGEIVAVLGIGVAEKFVPQGEEAFEVCTYEDLRKEKEDGTL